MFGYRGNLFNWTHIATQIVAWLQGAWKAKSNDIHLLEQNAHAACGQHNLLPKSLQMCFLVLYTVLLLIMIFLLQSDFTFLIFQVFWRVCSELFGVIGSVGSSLWLCFTPNESRISAAPLGNDGIQAILVVDLARLTAPQTASSGTFPSYPNNRGNRHLSRHLPYRPFMTFCILLPMTTLPATNSNKLECNEMQILCKNCVSSEDPFNAFQMKLKK